MRSIQNEQALRKANQERQTQITLYSQQFLTILRILKSINVYSVSVFRGIITSSISLFISSFSVLFSLSHFSSFAVTSSASIRVFNTWAYKKSTYFTCYTCLSTNLLYFQVTKIAQESVTDLSPQ